MRKNYVIKSLEEDLGDLMSGSESVYGFCGWLTSRDKKTIMSSTDDAGVIADLIDMFVKTNKLSEPKDGWEKNLIHPKG